MHIPDPAVLDHVRRLRADAPEVREDAARQTAAVAWAPEEQRYLASALAEAAAQEADAAALAAQLDALPALEAALDDEALHRLCAIRSESPLLAALLARAARLQIAGPVEPAGGATLAVVRCLRGVPRPGLTFRTPHGERVVLERIGLYGKVVNRLYPPYSARVVLSGPGARALGEWDQLHAEGGMAGKRSPR